MKIDIWMPIYIKDYMASTSRLSTLEHGAYLLLLFDYWVNGELPNDNEILLQITKQPTKNLSVIIGILNRFFKLTKNNTWINERIEKELEKAKNNRESAKENGRKGGRPSKKITLKETMNEDWDEMLKFFDNSCLNCGCKFKNPNGPTKDHIIPKIVGGDDSIHNLQPLCRECNSSKCADHGTDYRLKYINQIPESLKNKWFVNKPKQKAKRNPETTSSPSPIPIPITINNIIIETIKEIPIEWKDLFTAWLEYKKERGQTFKSKKTALVAYKNLIELSGDNLETAKRIVQQSIANNYAGLFPLKNIIGGNNNEKSKFQRSVEAGREFVAEYSNK